MFWCWLILLFGTEVAFAHQNLDRLSRRFRRPALAPEPVDEYLGLAALLSISARFHRRQPALSLEDLVELLPSGHNLANRVIRMLQDCNLVVEVVPSQTGAFPPVSPQPAPGPGDGGRGPGLPAALPGGRPQPGPGGGARVGRGLPSACWKERPPPPGSPPPSKRWWSLSTRKRGLSPFDQHRGPLVSPSSWLDSFPGQFKSPTVGKSLAQPQKRLPATAADPPASSGQ